MPLVGFKCPGIDQDNDVSFCLDKCINPCVPEGIVSAIWEGEKIHERSIPYDKGVSVTELLGCPQQSVLKQKMDYFVEPAKSFYSMRGKLIHGILSSLPKDDWEVEKVLPIREFCGVPIGGRIDAYRKSRKLLRSWKTIGDFGMTYLKDGARQRDILQEYIYCWLAPEMEVESIEITYISMMQIATTGKTFEVVRYHRGVPKEVTDHHRNLVGYECDGGYKHTLTFKIPEVHVISRETIERHMHVLGLGERAAEIWSARNGGGIPVSIDPGSMGDKNAGWRCRGYCPDAVAKACSTIHPNNQHNPYYGKA